MTIRRFLILLVVFQTQLLFAQETTKEVPPLIPYWAFGHWIWEDERNTRDAVELLVEGYKKNDIQVDAIIIDSPWMTMFNDFIWNETQYPKPQEMIDRLHQKGIKVLPWYTGCLNSSAYKSTAGKCKTYDFAVGNNFCINNNKESVWMSKGPGVHVDFTNDAAKKWWHTQVDALHSMHLDGAKIDFGFVWFGDSVKTSKGKLSQREFAFQYYSEAFDYNVSQNPEFVAMTYAWSGLGLMGFPSKSHVNWVGDFSGDWKGIKDQLKNIYRSANYGFSGIGCEIGGYWGIPSNKEQFIRYAQLGSLCPIMINGGALGAFKHHLPWNYDAETIDIYRKSVKLHNELSYYLFSSGVDAHLSGGTIIKNASIENSSHFLGDQLYVKVIVDSIPVQKFQVPESGYWIDYYNDDQIYKPGEIIERKYALDQYPIFIKAGSIIPIKTPNKKIIQEGDFAASDLTILVYTQGKESYLFHQPLGNGTEYKDVRIAIDEEKGLIQVKSEIKQKFVFKVKCFAQPNDVVNADKWEYDNATKILTIEKYSADFELFARNLKGYKPGFR